MKKATKKRSFKFPVGAVVEYVLCENPIFTAVITGHNENKKEKPYFLLDDSGNDKFANEEYIRECKDPKMLALFKAVALKKGQAVYVACEAGEGAATIHYVPNIWELKEHLTTYGEPLVSVSSKLFERPQFLAVSEIHNAK